MKTFVKNLQSLGLFTGGIIAHHYGSKHLDHKESIEDSLHQSQTDATLNGVANDLKTVMESCIEIKSCQAEGVNPYKLGQINELLNQVNDKGKSILENLDKFSRSSDSVYKDSFHKEVADMVSVTNKVNNLLQETLNITESKNNLLPSVNDIYTHLNNMSLLEEASLLHILLFSLILLTVFNILITIFSNEIIKYFKLEDKHPYLYSILQLRKKLQRYSIIWNISILFIICMAGILINILAIYCLN